MVMENMWNEEVFYFTNFCLRPTGTAMLRGGLNTLHLRCYVFDITGDSAILNGRFGANRCPDLRIGCLRQNAILRVIAHCNELSPQQLADRLDPIHGEPGPVAAK
jgi:hypothetical protein